MFKMTSDCGMRNMPEGVRSEGVSGRKPCPQIDFQWQLVRLGDQACAKRFSRVNRKYFINDGKPIDQARRVIVESNLRHLGLNNT